MMRTTLTLDADVAIALERLKSDRGMSLKAAVNEALRHGLKTLAAPTPEAEAPYRLRAWDGGRCLLSSLDDVAEALAFGEGEGFR